MNRWISGSLRPHSPFFIGAAQRVPSRTKRRSVEGECQAVWRPGCRLKISSAGSVLPDGGKLLPSAPIYSGRTGAARQADSLPRVALCSALCYGKASHPLPCFGMAQSLAELRPWRGPVHRCSRPGIPEFPQALRKCSSRDWSQKAHRVGRASPNGPGSHRHTDPVFNGTVLLATGVHQTGDWCPQPSIRLLHFAFLGFKPLPRGLLHDPIHDHAGSPSLLLNLSA